MEQKIITDFYQTIVTIRPETKACLDDYKNGNCVTIALIKAALAQFHNVAGIFNYYEEDFEQIQATFRDEYKVSINVEELEIVRRISGIKKNEDSHYYEAAIKLYTIIAKRVYLQKENYSEKCILSFKHAVEYLNSGYPTEIAHELLALGKRKIKIRKIKNYKSVIIRSGAHASYCSYGVQDIMGKAVNIKRIGFFWWMKNPIGVGGIIKEAYILQ